MSTWKVCNNSQDGCYSGFSENIVGTLGPWWRKAVLSLHPSGFSSPVVQVLIQLLSSPAELWEVRTKSYLGKLPCRQTAHWDFVSTTSQPRMSPAWSKGAAFHDRVNKAKSQAWWGGRTIFSSDSVATNPWLPSGLMQVFAPCVSAAVLCFSDWSSAKRRLKLCAQRCVCWTSASAGCSLFSCSFLLSEQNIRVKSSNTFYFRLLQILANSVPSSHYNGSGY